MTYQIQRFGGPDWSIISLVLEKFVSQMVISLLLQVELNIPPEITASPGMTSMKHNVYQDSRMDLPVMICI